MGYRDSFPHDNAEGEGHFTGTECPCCPWCFTDGDGKIVVVHGHWTEQIIYTGAPEAYTVDTVLIDEVTWEIQ